MSCLPLPKGPAAWRLGWPGLARDDGPIDRSIDYPVGHKRQPLTLTTIDYLAHGDNWTPSDATCHTTGTIALTAFARTRDVASGAFSRIDALTGRLRNGVNLVVTKTANKVSE